MVPMGQNGGVTQFQRASFATTSDSNQQLTAMSNGVGLTLGSPTSNGVGLEVADMATPPPAMSNGENSQASEEVEGEEEEPLYVNAKQYERIVKRRRARAKLESEGRIPRNRQVNYFKL